MRRVLIRSILSQIAALHGDEQTKRQCAEIVRRAAFDEGVAAAEHLDRIGFAIALLEAKEHRRIIRDRIMQRYEVSKSTALRVIAVALSLRENASRIAYF